MTEFGILVMALSVTAAVYMVIEVVCAIRRVNRDRRDGR